MKNNDNYNLSPEKRSRSSSKVSSFEIPVTYDGIARTLQVELNEEILHNTGGTMRATMVYEKVAKDLRTLLPDQKKLTKISDIESTNFSYRSDEFISGFDEREINLIFNHETFETVNQSNFLATSPSTELNPQGIKLILLPIDGTENTNSTEYSNENILSISNSEAQTKISESEENNATVVDSISNNSNEAFQGLLVDSNLVEEGEETTDNSSLVAEKKEIEISEKLSDTSETIEESEEVIAENVTNNSSYKEKEIEILEKLPANLINNALSFAYDLAIEAVHFTKGLSSTTKDISHNLAEQILPVSNNEVPTNSSTFFTMAKSFASYSVWGALKAIEGTSFVINQLSTAANEILISTPEKKVNENINEVAEVNSDLEKEPSILVETDVINENILNIQEIASEAVVANNDSEQEGTAQDKLDTYFTYEVPCKYNNQDGKFLVTVDHPTLYHNNGFYIYEGVYQRVAALIDKTGVKRDSINSIDGYNLGCNNMFNGYGEFELDIFVKHEGFGAENRLASSNGAVDPLGVIDIEFIDHL